MPLALVFNELVLNAVKHRPKDGTRHPAVEVEVSGSQSRAEVRIFNWGGQLPVGFALGRRDDQGSGLGLVRSLLPRLGAELTVEEGSGGVVAHVVLHPPVIAPDDEAARVLAP